MKIPKEVKSTIAKLQKNGFEAYIVGGCVRDILRKDEPKDWDITTNAKPEEIQKLFKKSFLDNNFGTVTVLTGSKNEQLKEVEITPYRIEAKYTDKRHPDKISWAKTIKDDLSRRDFTVNAVAINLETHNIKHETKKLKREGGFKIVDPFNGQKDIENKIIQTVGNAKKRFSEDALRMLRAIRFAVCLGSKIWEIEEKTFQGIKKNAQLLELISKERIRDELNKIIMSPNGAKGIEILRRVGLLKYIIPELEQGFNIEQNKHHIYQVYQHILLSLNYACQNNFSKEVRWASLLHDIGKPKTKDGEGLNATFYNHEVVGAKMCYQILRRLKFSNKEVEKITKLVRFHLFYYNVDEVGESSVRRLLRRIGQENIEELLQVRMSDRIGSGVPKAEPYKLRHLKYLFEKVAKDPISVKTLKVSGKDVMKILNVRPGPKIGQVLSYLLEQALQEPRKNNKTYLEKEIKRLGKMSEQELEKVSEKAKQEIEEIEIKQDKMTKKKYWVT